MKSNEERRLFITFLRIYNSKIILILLRFPLEKQITNKAPTEKTRENKFPAERRNTRDMRTSLRTLARRSVFYLI